MRQFVVGNYGVVCSSPAHCRTDGIGRTGGAIGAFDDAGVGFGEVFNAFARTGGKNGRGNADERNAVQMFCLLYTSPSPRDKRQSRMPSSA